MKKWKEGTEKGEIAIREREMRESENGKRKWRFRFLKEDRRKIRATINENDKTRTTINAWHFGYPSTSGEGNVLETLRIENTSFYRPFTVAGCDIF